MANRTVSGALTLRVSTRQLAEGAYRALRVAGVPAGVAADAARDAVVLEREHGRGLEVLDEILRVGPLPLSAIDADNTHVDAGGASALLLAAPLVALAGDRAPSTVVLGRLAHCAALQPALLRSARAEGLAFVLSSADGADVLRVDALRSAIGPAWVTSWVAVLDVALRARRARTPARPGAHAQARRDAGGGERGLVVDGDRWHRLGEHAARYLV